MFIEVDVARTGRPELILCFCRQAKQEVLLYLEGAATDVELFTSPPKVVAEPTATLLELGLTPSANVYVSSDAVGGCRLDAEWRRRISSYRSAMKDAAQRLAANVDETLPVMADTCNHDHAVLVIPIVTTFMPIKKFC